jgi:hypothetical protein
MLMQVTKKVLVLDQPFLRPDAVRRVAFVEGLDGVHGSAFYMTPRNQTAQPKVDFSAQYLFRTLI